MALPLIRQHSSGSWTLLVWLSRGLLTTPLSEVQVVALSHGLHTD